MNNQKVELLSPAGNLEKLKLNHDAVHNSVQDYINEDCKGISDKDMLNNLSQKLDNSTIEVFKCLDQIKKDNVVENKQYVEKITKEKSVAPTQNSVKTFENNAHKTINTTTSNKKPTVITSSTKDDDEWESF